MRERTTWNKDEINRRASTSRTADPFTMNQDHPQPAPDAYVTGDPSSFAEDVHPAKDTWEVEYAAGQVKRDEIGMPEVRKDTFNHPEKTASKDYLVKKASLCVEVARRMLPKKADEKVVEDQAVALMHMPDSDLIETFGRLAEEQGQGQGEQKKDDQGQQGQQQQASQDGQPPAQQAQGQPQTQQAEFPPAQQQAQQPPAQQQAQQPPAQQQGQFPPAQQQAQQPPAQQAQQPCQAADPATIQSMVQAMVQNAFQQGVKQAQAKKADFPPAQQQAEQPPVQQQAQQPPAQQQAEFPPAPQAQQPPAQQAEFPPPQQQAEQPPVQQQAQDPLIDDVLLEPGAAPASEFDLSLEAPVMDTGEAVLGPEDEVLRTLFAADEPPKQEEQQDQGQQQGQQQQASAKPRQAKVIGTKPQGVSKIGGAAAPTGKGEDVTKLSSLWASAPDVSGNFR